MIDNTGKENKDIATRVNKANVAYFKLKKKVLQKQTHQIKNQRRILRNHGNVNPIVWIRNLDIKRHENRETGEMDEWETKRHGRRRQRRQNNKRKPKEKIQDSQHRITDKKETYQLDLQTNRRS